MPQRALHLYALHSAVVHMTEVAAILGPEAVWERWRHHLLYERERRPRTVQNYRRTVHDFWGFIAPKPWHRAGPKDLTRFIDQAVRSNGRRVGERLAANTRKSYAVPIRNIYRWCYEAGILPKDRMAGFTIPKGGHSLPRDLDPADLHRVLLEAEDDERLYLMVWLAYGAGLRAMEIAQLWIEDCYLGEHPFIAVRDGKGGYPRDIPMFPELRAALQRYLKAARLPAAGPLFPSRWRPGLSLNPDTVSTILCRYIHGLGIERTGHGLRHSFAVTLLAEGGEDRLLTVSRLLGHRTTKVTEQTYLLGYRGEPERVIGLLSDPRRNGRKNLKR